MMDLSPENTNAGRQDLEEQEATITMTENHEEAPTMVLPHQVCTFHETLGTGHTGTCRSTSNSSSDTANDTLHEAGAVTSSFRSPVQELEATAAAAAATRMMATTTTGSSGSTAQETGSSPPSPNQAVGAMRATTMPPGTCWTAEEEDEEVQLSVSLGEDMLERNNSTTEQATDVTSSHPSSGDAEEEVHAFETRSRTSSLTKDFDSGNENDEDNFVESIPIIQAQLADDQATHVMVAQAELVAEPPMAMATRAEEDEEAYPAVEHVEFDEEAPSPPGYYSPTFRVSTSVEDIHREQQASAVGAAANGDNDGDDDSITKMKQFWSRNSKLIWRCHLFLLLLGLIVAVAVPRYRPSSEVMHGGDNLPPPSSILEDDALIGVYDDDLMDDLMDAGGYLFPNPAPTPAPSALSVYDCYDSTLKIAMAQIKMTKAEHAQEDSNYHSRRRYRSSSSSSQPSSRTFIICPNTKIPIGSLADPDAGDYRIVNGDYPLTALTDSIEIRCGLNGHRDNQCVLDGGFLQVLLHPSLPGELGEMTAVNRTDNVVFRGITFTGQLGKGGGDDESIVENKSGSGSSNSSHAVISKHSIGGVSVLANNPGHNITFVDCEWKDVVAPRGLIQVGDDNNPWASTFSPTTDVTFEDCTFSNIEIGSSKDDTPPMIGVYGEAVTIRRSIFQDILYPAIEPRSGSNSTIGAMLGGNGTLASSSGMERCHGLLCCFERSDCALEDICVDQAGDSDSASVVAAASSKANLTVSGSYNVATGDDLSLNCSTGLIQYTDPSYQHAVCLTSESSDSAFSQDKTCVL